MCTYETETYTYLCNVIFIFFGFQNMSFDSKADLAKE